MDNYQNSVIFLRCMFFKAYPTLATYAKSMELSEKQTSTRAAAIIVLFFLFVKKTTFTSIRMSVSERNIIEDGYLRTRPRGRSTDSKLRRFLEKRSLKLKITDGSIGIDLTSKKDFM